MDLGANSHITRLEIVNILIPGDNGVGWDNFNFAPVPEPGTYALMLLGLGALAAVGRRRRG